MKDTIFFYRHGIHCLVHKNERSDEWMCFVGFDSKHPLFSVGFYKTNVAAIYRYRSVNLITTNSVWSQLNWLGCSDHPYSEAKTTDLVKQIADEIAGVKAKPTATDDTVDEVITDDEMLDDDETLDSIFDMVDII